ncbi:hypothetical protein AVEN_194470-1 [Araneus ventricosus]|uniref:Uncharacterized protein n=1 Tax=Araneus ventricosus TaxID=182803 RepID=A0A4Y2A637_ARAVE|nr:hypothetical protein AVEN_194470-1 [Araneus ventricosus]
MRATFGTDLVNLNRCQATSTEPELAPLLQTSAPHQRKDVRPLTYDLTCNRPNTRRISSGIRFRTWDPPGYSAYFTQMVSFWYLSFISVKT